MSTAPHSRLGVATEPLVLDVWADIACPWCYIGHRHLDEVVAREADDVRVQHRAYQLQPDLPPRGLPMREWGEQKFGGAEAMSQMFARVIEVGRTVGIAFDFEAMPVAPNTVLAHRALAALADRPVLQRAAVDALFSAYFEHGRDITDVDVLAAQVAAVTGISVGGLVAAINAPQTREAVEADFRIAAQLGISAVPTFVADGRLAVQGAQPPGVLQGLLDQVHESAADAG